MLAPLVPAPLSSSNLSVCVCCAGSVGTVGAAAASGVGAAGTNGADTGDGVVAGGCCFFFSASLKQTEQRPSVDGLP